MYPSARIHKCRNLFCAYSRQDMFLEKQILDHVGYFIASKKYSPSLEEQACIAFYDRSPIYYTIANFIVWGSMAYYTIDLRSLFGTSSIAPNQPQTKSQIKQETKHATSRPVRPPVPRWITIWGIAAITAGAFAGTYLTSKMAARNCLQCLLDVENKKSELYQTTRKLLAEHHPDANKYFKSEKHKDQLA